MGPEGLPSEGPCEVCRELIIAFQRLFIEYPTICRSGMAALVGVLGGHGLDLCWLEATFGVAGHFDLRPVFSLARESWVVDLLDKTVVDGLAGDEGGQLGVVEHVWSRGGLDR